MRANQKWFFINKGQESDHLTQSPGIQWSEIQKHVQTGLKRPRKAGKTKVAPGVRRTNGVDDKALYDATIRSLSCKFDPFSTASVHIDGTVRGLLHYYIYKYHPTIWTYTPETLRSRPYAFKDSVVRVVNTCVGDELAMYSLLSASISRIQHIDNLSFPSAVDKEHQFMGKALQLMQKRIENNAGDLKSTEQILLCIMFLGTAEAYRDNLAAAMVHLQTTLKLLGPEGVMNMADKNIQGQILMSDLFLACIYMQPCLCDYGAYDPGPASTLNLADSELSPFDTTNHGSTFLQQDGIILPSPLWQIVREILESYRVNRQLNIDVMTSERAFQTTHWVAKRNMAIRSRILATTTADDRIFALKMAIIMWTLLAMNITGRIKTVKMMSTTLKNALKKMPCGLWDDYEDVHLWILLVGHSCARDDSNELGWFANQIKTCRWKCLSPSISEAGSALAILETFLNGFLYHPTIQKSRIETLAGLLELSDRSELSKITPSSTTSFEIVRRGGVGL